MENYDSSPQRTELQVFEEKALKRDFKVCTAQAIGEAFEVGCVEDHQMACGLCSLQRHAGEQNYKE